MAAFKQFNSEDIIISPLEVNKGFTFQGNALTASNVNISRYLGKKDNFLTKSIRPIYRKQDNGKLVSAPKLPEEDATKVKSKKVSRIYIMGKTVPIFRSVIPKIKPI